MNLFNNYNDLLKKGYLDLEIDNSVNLKDEIKKLRREKNAVILAHYYQEPEIQDIADIIGDSLYLSQKASETTADIIVFCGVHFMAETAKIICRDKKVLLPDLNAGCSLSDSCKAEDFEKFLLHYPGYKVISYINSSAEIKALSHIICTSSNAVRIVESFDKKEKLIFAPDKNLGNYINSITDRNMVIWNGACHVHEQFSIERILKLKEFHSEAKIVAHPECVKQVLLVADYIGSTAALLKYTIENDATEFIVATESGIIHQMKKACPNKLFIPAPPKDSTCACSECNFMKLNTMKKLFLCLKHELPEIIINEEISKKAEFSIRRMLELSK